MISCNSAGSFMLSSVIVFIKPELHNTIIISIYYTIFFIDENHSVLTMKPPNNSEFHGLLFAAMISRQANRIPPF